ncbi:class I SAM-dependent methyltransferase, partial [Candidatus Roizmanbacteria bacterium]|nr:class I SAM-dependent methyltransferase [Candidatus Roizmanbacteria bacterium]
YFDAKEWHNYQPKDWQLKITGVDIYKGYLSELQEIIYNDIIIGDIFKVLPSLGIYDLAVLADIIEHFTKEEGLKLLDELFKHVEDIVITTPLGFLLHKGYLNNPHEEHKSGWLLEDFEKYNVIDKAIIPRIRKKEKLMVIYLRKRTNE